MSQSSRQLPHDAQQHQQQQQQQPPRIIENVELLMAGEREQRSRRRQQQSNQHYHHQQQQQQQQIHDRRRRSDGSIPQLFATGPVMADAFAYPSTSYGSTGNTNYPAQPPPPPPHPYAYAYPSPTNHVPNSNNSLNRGQSPQAMPHHPQTIYYSNHPSAYAPYPPASFLPQQTQHHHHHQQQQQQQQQHQQQPPYYGATHPPAQHTTGQPRSHRSTSSGGAGETSALLGHAATALTMDDIEHAFEEVLYKTISASSSQQQGDSQAVHPLKKGADESHPLTTSTRSTLGDWANDAAATITGNRSSGSKDADGHASLPRSRSPSESNLRTSQPPPPPPPQQPRRGSRGGHRRLGSSDSLPRPTHRRVSSDIPLKRYLATSGAGGGGSSVQHAPRPQYGSTSTRTDPQKFRKQYEGNRNRSLSAGPDFLLPPSPRLRPSSGGGRPPQHRRQSSYGANSVATDMSMMSVVSDIRKSAFFSGYNESGDAQLHYPISQVHLVMGDKSLTPGRLYQVPIDPEAFEDYHQTAEDVSLGFGGGAGGGPACGCSCAHCLACQGKQSLLPPNYYAVAVQEDLYRRVLDEICASKSMPCGLFFCGHHEDVSRPSIWIATIVVVMLFTGMGWAAVAVSA